MEMNNYHTKNNDIPLSENGEDTAKMDERQKLIKSFGSYTTLHGFHFLTDSGSALRRILWLTLMIVCLVILIFQLRDNYAKLQRHDSMVTKDIEFTRSLLFPAVSICNQNMLQRSKILGTESQLYLDALDTIKAELKSSRNVKPAQLQSNYSFDIEEAVREAGHNLTTMMSLCSWRGQKCGPENFTSFVSFYVSAQYFYF